MNKEIVDYVVGKLADVPATNNLAARIHVLFKSAPSGFAHFKDEQIYSIRKIAEENKDTISDNVMENINKLADYFESILIADKLK